MVTPLQPVGPLRVKSGTHTPHSAGGFRPGAPAGETFPQPSLCTDEHQPLGGPSVGPRGLPEHVPPAAPVGSATWPTSIPRSPSRSLHPPAPHPPCSCSLPALGLGAPSVFGVFTLLPLLEGSASCAPPSVDLDDPLTPFPDTRDLTHVRALCRRALSAAQLPGDTSCRVCFLTLCLFPVVPPGPSTGSGTRQKTNNHQLN